MSKEKKVNYTDTQVTKMVAMYVKAGDQPDQEVDRKEAILAIQEFTGKTVNSIRAKLTFEKVYIPLIKAETKGKNGLSKSELVAAIQDGEPSKPSGFFDSLETANKLVLGYVLEMQGALSEMNFNELDGDYVEPVKDPS